MSGLGEGILGSEIQKDMAGMFSGPIHAFSGFIWEDLEAGVIRELGTTGASGEQIPVPPVCGHSVFGVVGLSLCMAAGLQEQASLKAGQFMAFWSRLEATRCCPPHVIGQGSSRVHLCSRGGVSVPAAEREAC